MGREGGHELYLSIGFDFAYCSNGFLSSVKRLWPSEHTLYILYLLLEYLNSIKVLFP
jgi:hypothetical protein